MITFNNRYVENYCIDYEGNRILQKPKLNATIETPNVSALGCDMNLITCIPYNVNTKTCFNVSL